MEKEEDELEKELLSIELDKKMCILNLIDLLEFEGGQRIRKILELGLSRSRKFNDRYLDDGSFNTIHNVEEHQLKTYQKVLSK